MDDLLLGIGIICQQVRALAPGPNSSHVGRLRERIRERACFSPVPPPLPKPRLYKLYFPHVASFGPWETEVTLTNTSEVAVHGDLQAFKEDGTLPGQSMPVNLPALGRKQVVVGNLFQNPQDIAYLAFVCDSGLVAG